MAYDILKKCSKCKYYEEARYVGSFKIYRLCHFAGHSCDIGVGFQCPKPIKPQTKPLVKPETKAVTNFRKHFPLLIVDDID